MNRSTLDYALRKVVDLYTRPTTVARVLLGAGTVIIVASLGAQVDLVVDQTGFQVTFGGGGFDLLGLIGLGLGIVLFLAGVCWALIDQRAVSVRNAKQTTIVVESRGLRDENGVSLESFVKKATKGQVQELLVDIRPHMRDGQVENAQAAADEVLRLPGDLRRRRGLKDRDDVSIAYGGLTPVPFTFLMGVLLDDEGPVGVYDWDRSNETWRPLEDADDGHRFLRSWNPPEGPTDSVVLAISCSYPILDANLALAFPGVPVMSLKLQGPTTEAHWSAEKQTALVMDVLEAAKLLEGAGVRTIHLVIAAPNSLVFQIGTKWDRRNIPRATVYQFERNDELRYPWGLQLPGLGEDVAAIQGPPASDVPVQAVAG